MCTQKGSESFKIKTNSVNGTVIELPDSSHSGDTLRIGLLGNWKSNLFHPLAAKLLTFMATMIVRLLFFKTPMELEKR